MGSLQFDVQSVNPRPHPPVRNDRCGHNNCSFHPNDQFRMPFFGIRRLWRDGSPIVKTLTAVIAIAIRTTSRSLTFINATGLIVISCLQFSHLVDNCYCNTSVIGSGTGSYILASLEGWIFTMRTSRITGTVLSAASMAIYMVFLWVFNSLPSEIIGDL